MILSEALHARAKRVVLEYISMVLLKACWAPSVILVAQAQPLQTQLGHIGTGTLDQLSA